MRRSGGSGCSGLTRGGAHAPEADCRRPCSADSSTPTFADVVAMAGGVAPLLAPVGGVAVVALSVGSTAIIAVAAGVLLSFGSDDEARSAGFDSIAVAIVTVHD